MLMHFLWAFVVGGLFCVIGQILMQRFKLTPAHTMVTFVIAGAILGGLGWFQPIADFAGAGATTPIINFGASLVKGATQEFNDNGWIGLLTGIFEVTGAGVSSAIIFSFLAALFFRPKS
jgi:stage V sporulation protein AE